MYAADCLREEVLDHAPFVLHVVSRPPEGAGVRPPAPERMFAWLARSRRLAKDCERLAECRARP